MADDRPKYENPLKVDLNWSPPKFSWKSKSKSKSKLSKADKDEENDDDAGAADSTRDTDKSALSGKVVLLTTPPQWLPIPKIVLFAFGINLIFILVAIIVSGLVLGGTITIKATAIGLTQSLVLFSAMFGLTYICFHTFAARKALDAGRLLRSQRSHLHTTIAIMGRITIALWLVAMLAVGITLGKEPSSEASSLGPLRANLATCIINAIDMLAVAYVVERTTMPFVLPRITPPIPESQSLSAKALIDDIIGDGISGRPHEYAAQASAAAAETVPATVPSVPSAPPEPPQPAAAPAEPCPYPQSYDTSAERREIWNRVDEGAYAASAPPVPLPMPPTPSSTIPPILTPARTTSPYHNTQAQAQAQARQPPFAPQFPPQPYISPMQHHAYGPRQPPPPQPYMSASTNYRAANHSAANYHPSYSASNLPTTSNGYGTSPAPPSGTGYNAYSKSPRHAYNQANSSANVDPLSGRLDGTRSVPPPAGPRPPVGKTLFNKAVEGLRANGQKTEVVWEDPGVYKIPGSFVDM